MSVNKLLLWEKYRPKISHPANCRLMKHTDNISKNKKSVLTLEELLEKIKKFDGIQ